MDGVDDYVKGAREIDSDAWTGSFLVGKLCNCLMRGGKKSVASVVVRSALERAGTALQRDDYAAVLRDALENLKPQVEVRSKRVGGATYQVPTTVGAKRRQTLAIRWLLEAARGRSGRRMSERLGDEIVNAIRREGVAYTKKDNVHRMAEANKAFAHFG